MAIGVKSNVSRVMRGVMVAGLVAGVFAPAALGHDFWLLPTDFTPAAGSVVGVRIEIGHAGEAEAYPRNPQRIEKFIIVGPGEKALERVVGGAAGSDPAGEALVSDAGVSVIGYRSNHARSELEAAKFEAYLREEGLEEISERRAAEGQTGTAGKEMYSRCAKTLVRASAGAEGETRMPDANAERVLGFTLEIVPVGDPTAAKAGDEQRVRVMFKGAPYKGAKVEFTAALDSMRGGGHAAPVSARTDAAGEASVRLNHAGLWVVNCVVMEDAPEGSGADWESWWASLTFEVAGG
jgi:uncharacterized GH25 family protein